MIKLKRNSGWADGARAYKIVLDDKVIGKINDGEEIEIDIPAGKHKLFLKIDWCRSNSVEFDASGNRASFECGNRLRGWKIFLSVFYIIFMRGQYLWLKKVS